MKRLFAIVVTGCLAALPADALGRRPPNLFPDLPRAELQVITATATHRFQVWIAADDRSRARGLMHVRALPADHGMLFLFARPQIASFWMKDTFIPLDIIFIDQSGQVTDISRETTPHSLQPIESTRPVAAVLELAAGTTDRIALETGNEIRYQIVAAALER